MTATAHQPELYPIHGSGWNYGHLRQAIDRADHESEHSTMNATSNIIDTRNNDHAPNSAITTRRPADAGGELAQAGPLQPEDVVGQVRLVQHVMRDVMKRGEHFDSIPGCGPKPALLQPGAQKLAMTFRLRPSYDIELIDLERGHREYRVRCQLVHIQTGEVWGESWGSCSSMESKYRWRDSQAEVVSHEVPGRYWQLKKQGKRKEAAEFLPAGCKVMKQHDGSWAIVKCERRENPDLADTFNTVLKMATKRAFVGAVLSTTAASDIFGMADFAEDDPEADHPHHSPDDAGPPDAPPAHVATPPASQQRSTANAPSPAKVLGDAGAERLRAKLGQIGRTFDDVLAHLKATNREAHDAIVGVDLDEIPAAAIPAIHDAVQALEREQVTAAGAPGDSTPATDAKPAESQPEGESSTGAIDDDDIPF